MHKETTHEKNFHNLLPPDLAKVAQVTFGYQDHLRIINKHLKTLYGDYADWDQCLKEYFSSDEYQRNCHHVLQCEDIPLLTKQQIEEMAREDEEYHRQIDVALAFFNEIKGENHSPETKLVFQAAELMGIMPKQKEEGLYRWLIARNGLTDGKKREVLERMKRTPGLLFLAADYLVTLFVPGLQLTFPIVGTAMTQQKGKYYYRGESAYYGSSKPGIFRQKQSGFLANMSILADRMILDEACFFLDNFDAIKYWRPSAVNYLALAQHYGIKTPLLDLTSNFKTALFFACCKYQYGQWRPLTKRDLDRGNPRYGILYRSPTEITDIKWALMGEDTAFNIIIPVGYQPFMRCSNQYGYMLWADDPEYDLLQDPLFDKFRFEQDEELCRWIYEEMDRGNKVYPNDDIPHLDQYMEKIRDSRRISQYTFESIIDARYSRRNKELIRKALQKIGYSVVSGQVEYITHNRLRKINRQYSVETALSKMDVEPKARPMITISSDTLVEPDNDETSLMETAFKKSNDEENSL